MTNGTAVIRYIHIIPGSRRYIRRVRVHRKYIGGLGTLPPSRPKCKDSLSVCRAYTASAAAARRFGCWQRPRKQSQGEPYLVLGSVVSNIALAGIPLLLYLSYIVHSHVVYIRIGYEIGPPSFLLDVPLHMTAVHSSIVNVP